MAPPNASQSASASPLHALRAGAQVLTKRIKRIPMHRTIKDAVTWTPLTNPEPGYTVIIACMRELAPIAAANLSVVSQMKLNDLRELILIFDCQEHELPPSITSLVASLRDRLPIRVLTYSPAQAAAAAKLRWGWVYAWMSWCLGVGASRTRHVILHDLDALPLNPQLFDLRYQQALQNNSKFHGVRWYQGNGVLESMRLAVTFELVLDAQHVRANFRPFHVFNHVSLIDGRYVDFDTFLYVESKSDARTVEPLPESELVHPSQMICQYTDFVAGRNKYETTGHNLLIPYYAYLGGDANALDAVGARCADPAARSVPFAGKELPITGMAPSHWAWLEKQIRRAEQALHGATRPEVEQYLTGFIARAGDARTVGREQGEAAVALR